MDYLDILLKIVLATLALFGVQNVFNRISIKFRKQSNTLSLQNSSEENVGRDKIVTINHNYTFQTVSTKEELLRVSEISEPKTIEAVVESNAVPLLPSERPKEFNKTPDEVVKSVSAYMRPVILKATPKRDVAVDRIIENAKKLFTSGRYRDDKDYWVHHCASSMREILVFVEPGHFSEAYKNIPEASDPQVSQVFEFLMLTTNYYSSIIHHRAEDRMGDAEKLYRNEGYGTMSKTDFLAQEEVFFERVSIDLVYTLDSLFKAYCVNDKKIV